MKKILHLLNKQTLLCCLFLISVVAVGQTTIIPKLFLSARNTPSGNTGWTITAVTNNAGTDYWKMLAGTNSMTSPEMNFSTYSDIKVTLVLQSFGTITSNSDKIKVEYFNGTTWNQIGGLLTTGSQSTQIVSFPSDAISSNAKIRITAPNATSAVGARVFSVEIKGTMPTFSSPSVTNTTTTNISTTAADFAGNVTATGGSDITANGTVYSVKATNANPQIGGSGVTNLATSSPAAGTGIFSNPSGAVLSPNLQYSYNAYATNTTGTGYGTVADFWTLGNVPSAISLSGAQVSSLSVSLNTTDGNPATTEYAIQETTTGNYVQNDGTLGATASWNIAGALGWNSPISVIGLTANTSYTFQVKARNGANVETAFSTTTSLSTLPNSSPNLVVNALNDFDPTCINTSAVEQTLEISGSNLNADAITVGPLAGFTFSTNSGATYTAQASLNADGSGDLNADVLVQFTPSAVQSYNGNIVVTGGGANAINVSVVASGINTTATATTVTSYGILANSATVEGNFTEGCSAITEYGIEYSTTNNFTNGTGTKVTSSNSNAGNFTASISGLLSSTTYYFKAFATDGSGTVYGTQSSFVTDALAAPVATAGTSVSHTGFTANWNAVVGATGYELDVSDSENFGTLTTSQVTEGFETGLSGSYQTGTVVLSSGSWIVTDVLKGSTGTNSGSASAQLKSATNAALVSPSFANGISSFTFWVTASTTSGSIQINYSTDGGATWIPSTDSPFTSLATTKTQKTITLNTTVPTIFQIKRTAATIYIDDIEINSNVITPSFLAGYESKQISGGSTVTEIVSGLNSETEYFYRVRATDGAASANSNEISVTTLVGTTTYTEGAWTNGTPTAVLDAIIADNFTTTGDLSVKSLTINSGKVFTVATGTTLTIVNALTNNAGLTGFVVESDGVVLQNSTVTNTALATVKRNSTPLFRQDYTVWSSPVFEPNLRNFSPQTLFNRFSTYDFSTSENGGYKQEINNNEEVLSKKFVNAKGYLIRMPNNANEVASGNAQTFVGEFKGVLNNGTITIPLYGNVPGTSNGLNLVGNPYPSPININTFFAENTQLTSGTMYFWRKKGSASDTNNSISGYATYNALGMVSADGTIQGQTLTHIKPGQGFFVKTAQATPADLVFNNTMRESTSTLFFKSSNQTATELNRFWLNLSKEGTSVGQTLIGYTEGATQEVDSSFDALYFNDAPLALTSLVNNEEYIIQGRALPFSSNDVVPLSFKTDIAGSFTISLSNFEGLFASNQDIFLKDKFTNTVQNLKTAAYTFTAPVGVFNNRFEVQYDSVLGTNNPNLGTNTILIGVKNQQIKINAGTVMMEKIELIDLSGRVLYTLENVNSTLATIENVVSSNQMLIVRISTKENGVVNQKIIF